MRMPLQELGQTRTGTRHVHIGGTFHLDQIIGAHRGMEGNKAG
ncbi:MAG: hypothetical protein WCD47_10955 [Candidatus Sulfotelmatobacter sp.]